MVVMAAEMLKAQVTVSFGFHLAFMCTLEGVRRWLSLRLSRGVKRKER